MTVQTARNFLEKCYAPTTEIKERTRAIEALGVIYNALYLVENIDNHDEEIRNKTIDEVKKVVEENLGGDAWVTIKQVLNNELDKLKGNSDE